MLACVCTPLVSGFCALIETGDLGSCRYYYYYHQDRAGALKPNRIITRPFLILEFNQEQVISAAKCQFCQCSLCNVHDHGICFIKFLLYFKNFVALRTYICLSRVMRCRSAPPPLHIAVPERDLCNAISSCRRGICLLL
jgi:hypothetical protein